MSGPFLNGTITQKSALPQNVLARKVRSASGDGLPITAFPSVFPLFSVKQATDKISKKTEKKTARSVVVNTQRAFTGEMAGVTKVTLELDDGGNEFGSLVDASIADGVENEKCVVSQYRTSLAQKQAFIQLLRNCPREDIPIEWVIDIADESNGWFYATAYSFDDVNQTLYVMVPDKINPTFKGNVQLDHRTVHLIECVDGKSLALFNKIVRDSVIKIKWDVEWFEEAEDSPGTGEGTWVPSSARYYIRIANQLLVEDKVQGGGETRGFVIITADMNVRLVKCHKNRGIDDFNRLINEGIVSSSEGAGGDSPEKGEGESSGSGVNVRKLAETARVLKECVVDLVQDRERKKQDEGEIAHIFHAFTVDGDLEQGLKLIHHFERVKRQNGHGDHGGKLTESDEEEEKMGSTAQDAKYLSGKIEKALVKVLQSGAELSAGGADEVEQLKRNIKKLKRDLDDKDRELRNARGQR